MLKIKTGIVIKGKFEKHDTYIQQIKESNFTTLIVDAPIGSEYDTKCMELVSNLASEGFAYGEKYVIARGRE